MQPLANMLTLEPPPQALETYHYVDRDHTYVSVCGSTLVYLVLRINITM